MRDYDRIRVRFPYFICRYSQRYQRTVNINHICEEGCEIEKIRAISAITLMQKAGGIRRDNVVLLVSKIKFSWYLY